MADGLTGRVLDSPRAVPYRRPDLVPPAEPSVERPSLSAVAVLAVVAALIGRRKPATPRARRPGKVLAVVLGAGVVGLAVWRPVISAYREHRYRARWSQQPLGW